MFSYAIRRLLGAVPTIFLIVTAAFFMMRVAPGGPFDQERTLEATVMENLNRTFGLDKPLWEQYAMYLGNLLRGDMGPSFIYRDMRVHEILAEGLPVSMQLGATALVLALVVGSALGTVAALRQNSRTDFAVIAVATFGITVPNFVVAPVLSLVFAVMLGWLPAQGWGDWNQMLLPVIALALPQVAIVARLIRGSMIEALRSDHVRTARAYGLPARMVVVKHALRAAILPAVSYMGPAAAALLTGSIVVEQVFNLPGIGRYFVNGALNRDYTLVMGTVVIVATFVVVFNLIVDLLYAVLDPRVRYD
ncbi:oligopeptide transport system permease protein [Rhodovulum imhoffii]|uniref:Oligopeptide transport system permease protein n=1 Tax=Rhodovulum imhoffii TaxID=365340 RepID=A0A2T5BRD5_9RHOB|nr:oligopeptide ABC transporter permease OppB [Rhodovulum imhoffii]MBK5934460.1 ABC transporter [Rhodovulum imhoffii]PTN01807.1 oligopeptide transport system permease protein [Rhodovulum imhoffii]